MDCVKNALWKSKSLHRTGPLSVSITSYAQQLPRSIFRINLAQRNCYNPPYSVTLFQEWGAFQSLSPLWSSLLSKIHRPRSFLFLSNLSTDKILIVSWRVKRRTFFQTSLPWAQTHITTDSSKALILRCFSLGSFRAMACLIDLFFTAPLAYKIRLTTLFTRTKAFWLPHKSHSAGARLRKQISNPLKSEFCQMDKR